MDIIKLNRSVLNVVRIKAAFFVLFIITFINTGYCNDKEFFITSYGAVDDGQTNNAAFIQKAIDDAFLKGGGKVIVPKGNFATGTIFIKSGVEFHIDLGGRLLGSTKRIDYDNNNALALIIAKDEKNISITGDGVIDGQAPELMEDIFNMLQAGTLQDAQWKYKRPTELSRPHLIRFINCSNVNVTGIKIKNSACWVQIYDRCNNLLIDNIRVESTSYWNNDGIDISDCKNVKVTNCFVNAGDDGICLKSEFPDACCDSIYIADCKIRSSANALKFGTASNGGFKNVIVRNLYIYDTYRSAIAIECVDGGTVENISIEKIIAKNTGNAVFIRLGRRNTQRPVGKLSGIRIADLKVEIPLRKPDLGYPLEGPPDYLRYAYRKSLTERPNLGYPFIGQPVYPYNLVPSSIVGIPGYNIKDVTLENIEIIFDGGGSRQVAHIDLDSLSKVPEKEDDYPEFSMFGELPAWGFYVRHAEGVKFNNVSLRYNNPDFRPALVFDDAKNISLNNVNILDGFEFPFVLFNNVKNQTINNLTLPVKNDRGIKEQ